MSFRLGLSITPKAIGWCLVDLDAAGRATSIRDLGTRVFSPNDAAGRDPANGESLAAQRREARRQRRRHKRRRLRKRQLMRLLIKAGLMPADEGGRKRLELLDPYELRARAVTEALSPHEVGRAVFHPARFRVELRELVVDAGPQLTAGIHQGDGTAGRTLVYRQYEFRHAYSP